MMDTGIDHRQETTGDVRTCLAKACEIASSVCFSVLGCVLAQLVDPILSDPRLAHFRVLFFHKQVVLTALSADAISEQSN